jgi:hypothetical protein
MSAVRYLLVSIDNANAPDVAHVVSEFYLGYGVDDADVPARALSRVSSGPTTPCS